MKSNYDVLGKYIRLIDTRNKDNVTNKVMGINIDKFFMPSVANVIGTDLRKYKLITKGKFACNPMHVGCDERLPVALYGEDEPALVSPAYFMFEIIDNTVLDENYLMMWFRRAEFDRICWLHTDGSVRGGITWDDICRMELPVVDIGEQRKIVEAYKIVDERIKLKRRINDNLREVATVNFFEKIRYRKCNPDNYQETEIGTYPFDWRIITLGEVLETIIDRRGVTPAKLGSEWSENGIIALSAKSVKNHELVNLDIANHVDIELYNRWMQQKLQPQDILMTSEAPLGEFYYLADFCEYCLSQRLFAMRANKNLIEPTLLYFQLTDTIGKHQIDIRKTGTTVTGIRQSELIKVPIVVPSWNVQSEFAQFCDPIMVTIEKNADEIAHLQSLKIMLLTQLSSL